ncbi:hypothetical protein GCM10023222_11700 [Saccharopolyspora cebuensis]
MRPDRGGPRGGKPRNKAHDLFVALALTLISATFLSIGIVNVLTMTGTISPVVARVLILVPVGLLTVGAMFIALAGPTSPPRISRRRKTE